MRLLPRLSSKSKAKKASIVVEPTIMGNLPLSYCLDTNEKPKPAAVIIHTSSTSCTSACPQCEGNGCSRTSTTLASPKVRRSWHQSPRRHNDDHNSRSSSKCPCGFESSEHSSNAHHRSNHPHDPSSTATTATTTTTVTASSTSEQQRSQLDPANVSQPKNHGVFHPSKAWHSLAQAVGHFLHRVQEFVTISNNKQLGSHHHKPPLTTVRGGVLLYGCDTPTAHYAYLQTALPPIQSQHGADGLRSLGLEFRLVPCAEHVTPWCPNPHTDLSEYEDEDENDQDNPPLAPGALAFRSLSALHLLESTSQPATSSGSPVSSNRALPVSTDSVRSNDGSCATPSHGDFNTTTCGASLATTTQLERMTMADEVPECICNHDDHNCSMNRDPDVVLQPETEPIKLFCNLCQRRLFHIASGTMVNEQNRAQFIADGDMYEAVSRLAQEHAQDIMMQEGGLEWITVEEVTPPEKDKEPLRVLISSDHPLLNENDNDRPTVFICTGRGKVRAGIFSRQNLICNGLETATALPMVRDAVSRHLNVVIVDPNAHGEAQGFVSFSKTCQFLEEYFGIDPPPARDDNDRGDVEPSAAAAHHPGASRDLYVLSHSASGGHLVRYFLEKPQSPFLRNIRAVAFTDSTHSIQWAAKSQDQKYLFDKLQSEQCVYFRVSKERGNVAMAGDGDKWYLHPAGEKVQTDSFWQHRFGKIHTMWAGTDEHAMTNWYAHVKIWDHFDFFLYGKKFRRPAPAPIT